MQNSSVDGRQNVILKLGQQHAEFSHDSISGLHAFVLSRGQTKHSMFIY